MITLDDLKAPGLWKFKMHADGSDKGGRFSINFHECEVNGIKLMGFRKEWRSGAGASGYSVNGVEAATLVEVVALLNQRFTAGDPEGRDD